MMTILTTKAERCGACHICELLCSYHHAQIFSRQMSSIEIYKETATGRVEICIHEIPAGDHRACDRCANEDAPLCAKWCPVGAIAWKKG